MKKLMREMYVAAGSIDQGKVGVIVFLVTLALFLAAGGAPDAGGSTVH